MYLQAGGLSEWFYFWTFPSLLFTVFIAIERVHVHWRHCLLHHEVWEVLITIYSDGFIITCVLHRQSIERTDIESWVVVYTRGKTPGSTLGYICLFVTCVRVMTSVSLPKSYQFSPSPASFLTRSTPHHTINTTASTGTTKLKELTNECFEGFYYNNYDNTDQQCNRHGFLIKFSHTIDFVMTKYIFIVHVCF